MSSMNLFTVLPCKYSPSACHLGQQAAELSVLIPLMIGVAILTIGLTGYLKTSTLKLVAVPAMFIGLCFICWWAMVFMAIAFHGLS